MPQISTFDIAEVARQTGIAASAIRFYEEKGLIHSIGRKGLKRIYDLEVFDRLALIALAQAAGFSLDEIGTMFGTRTARLQVNRDMLRAKADDLDAQIKHLSLVRDGLRHAAECQHDDQLECPTFRKVMRIGARKVIRDKKRT